MNLSTLLNQLGTDIVDTSTLESILGHHYRYPLDKIRGWVIKGELLPLKKGLYYSPVPGKEGSRSEPGLIANRLYGPSCVSLQYALAHYGLIPERVQNVTSITPSRDKKFETPIGTFLYRYQRNELYCEGYRLDPLGFLIALPEKALCDLIYFEKPTLDSPSDAENFLFQDLRIDSDELKKLSKMEFERWAHLMKRPSLKVFYDYIRKLL